MNIINANFYEEECCDFSFVPEEKKNITKDFFSRDGVIFCKTDYIDYLFQQIQFSPRKYVLLTHHSDYPIDHFRFKKRPKNIKTWFTVNPGPEVNSTLLRPLPLGTYVHKGRWQHHFSFFDYEWFMDNIERLRNKPKIEDTVYCNWGMTNGHRNDIIPLLEEKGIKYVWEEGLGYREFCESMSNYKFVISPPGNGPQCHRTWEAMYMGCVPIVVSNPADDAWSNELPMISVKDYGSPLDVNGWRYYTTKGYGDLTYEVLEEYIQKESNGEFSTEKMDLSYWKKKIREPIEKK